MSTLGIVLLVAFIIVSVLLVLLVVIQDDGENGMGGLLGGRSTAAFGSHSASVLSKATGFFVFLFICLAVGLAVVNKQNTSDEIKKAVEQSVAEEEVTDDTKVNKEWWMDAEETTTEAGTSDVGTLDLNNIDLSGLELPTVSLPPKSDQ